MKRRLPVTNLSSENNLAMFELNARIIIKAKVRTILYPCTTENTLGTGLITGTINCEFCDSGRNHNT